MKTSLLFTAMVITLLLMSACDEPNQRPFKAETQQSERTQMSKPQDSSNDRDKLKAIYDSAPERRAAVDKAVSGSSNPVRVDNNTEAPKLEAILKRSGWIDPTVTEGVKLAVEDGYIFKLEVIIDEAWYVIMKTDRSITTGVVQSKSKNSPW